MADEGAVARAVGADPTSLGFAGTLSLGADLERSGARIVPISGGGTGRAAFPVARQIAAGEYPLYHYLYLCCRPDPGAAAAFAAIRDGKWHADLPGLARRRLAQCGVTRVDGGGFCTFNDRTRFYSYRRERETGRMAAAVWLDG